MLVLCCDVNFQNAAQQEREKREYTCMYNKCKIITQRLIRVFKK